MKKSNKNYIDLITDNKKILAKYIEDIQRILGHRFDNKNLLVEALTTQEASQSIMMDILEDKKYTKSTRQEILANIQETKNKLGSEFVKCNEMLKFFGDRVFNLAVKIRLFCKSNAKNINGEVGKKLICGDSQDELFDFLNSKNNGKHIKLIKFAIGQTLDIPKNKTKNKYKKLKNDLIEAFCAAVYFDEKLKKNNDITAIEEVGKCFLNSTNYNDMIEEECTRIFKKDFEKIGKIHKIEKSSYNQNINSLEINQEDDKTLQNICNKIGYNFKNKKILRQSFIDKPQAIQRNFDLLKKQGKIILGNGITESDYKLEHVQTALLGSQSQHSNTGLASLGGNVLEFIFAKYLYQKSEDFKAADDIKVGVLSENALLNIFETSIFKNTKLFEHMKKFNQILNNDSVETNKVNAKNNEKTKILKAVCGAIFLDSKSISEVENFMFNKLKMNQIIDSVIVKNNNKKSYCKFKR